MPILPRPASRVLLGVAGAIAAVSTVTGPAARAGSEVAGASLVASLSEQARARVLIALREPQTPPGDLALRAAEIVDTRRGVLARLGGGFRLTEQWDTIPAVAGDLTPEGLRRALADPDVAKVDLDIGGRITLAESAALIRATDAHESGFTGQGVTVAVLDTGADRSHRDLGDSIVDEHCFCQPNCCPNGSGEQAGAGSAQDDNGHGTNVTGIITGNGSVAPRGVAPDASIVSIKVIARDGSFSSTAQILSGLDYVMRTRPDVKVVNLSLGTTSLFPGTCDGAASFTTAFASAFNALKGRGVSVFASSGNNGQASQIAFPGCVSSAIAVGAVYDSDVGGQGFAGLCSDGSTGADRITCFSNASSALDLLAPGAPITSAGLGGGASTFLGTSQACPHAAAAAALLLQARPAASPDQIEATLKGSGVAVTDTRNGQTFRRIDVRAALSALGASVRVVRARP